MFGHAFREDPFGFTDVVFIPIMAVYLVEDAGLVQSVRFVLGCDQLAMDGVDGLRVY